MHVALDQDGLQKLKKLCKLCKILNSLNVSLRSSDGFKSGSLVQKILTLKGETATHLLAFILEGRFTDLHDSITARHHNKVLTAFFKGRHSRHTNKRCFGDLKFL